MDIFLPDNNENEEVGSRNINLNGLLQELVLLISACEIVSGSAY